MSLPVDTPSTPDTPQAPRTPAAAAPGPAPRPRRTAAALAVVAALGLVTALAAPLLQGDRDAEATQDLHGRLQQVADAQERWKAGHGTYSTSLDALGVGGGETDLAIVHAGAEAFCAGAWDGGTRTSVFYSSEGGFSRNACG